MRSIFVVASVVVVVSVTVVVAVAFAACLHFVLCLPLYSACLLAFSKMGSKKRNEQKQNKHQKQQQIEEEGNKIMKYIAQQMTVCEWIYVKYHIIVSFATSSFWFFECLNGSIELLLGAMCKGCTKKCQKLKEIKGFINHGN